MKRIGIVLAAATFITLVGCGKKEEPQPVPQELPAPPVVVDTMPKVDTLKSVEESKTTTTTKKKTTTTAVQKNPDGTATGVQTRPSRTEKKEDDASSTQIRKSR